MTLLKLVCLFVLTWTCHASPQHDSGDSSGPSDYESLLKVVERLERRVEVVEILERRVEVVEMLERRVEALEAENVLQQSEITELKAAMQHYQETQKHDVSDENNGADGNSGECRQPSNRIRRASPELTIAFYAAVQTEVHHLGQGQNVPFDNVVTNVGNAYDGHVGVFKAPVAGIYVFSTTILTYVRDKAHYAFALNDQPITSLWVNGGENGGDADSQTIILQLRSGDDFSVQHTDSDHGLHGSSYSVFSGFLLSMTDEGSSSIVG